MRLIKTFALSYLYAQIAGAEEDKNAIQSMDDLITAEDLKWADKLDNKDNGDELALNAEMNAKNPNLQESVEFPKEVTTLWSEVKAERKKPAGWEGIVYDIQGNEVQESLNVQRSDTPHIYGVDCGVLGSASTRIVGGTNTGTIQNQNHVVYVYIGTLDDDDNAGPAISCQGSIIGEEWILTAASCFHNVNVDYIRIISGRRQIAPGSVENIAFTNGFAADVGDVPGSIPAVEYFPHPDFEYTSSASSAVEREDDEENKRNRNDIALLKLQSPIGAVSDESIGIACLPKTSMCLAERDNLMLEIAGWGSTQEGGNMVKKLKEGTKHIKQWGDCSHFFSTNSEISNNPFHQFLSAKEMCAGGFEGDADMCEGDEGGPLTFYDDNLIMTQVGISSWGFGCGRPNYPRIYTRVRDYLQYIKDVSGIYMVGDSDISDATPVDCHENGRNTGNTDRTDDSDFGFATKTVSSLDLTGLPQDKNNHIWSWNNPSACLAKKLRRQSLNNRNGKYLSLVQRCDWVRDGEEGNKVWGAPFELEYFPASGEIVQRGYDVVNATTDYVDEFCVMLTKKSVNIAACETAHFTRPRQWSQFDYLPVTGAFITNNRWENRPHLNYKYRVLFYPSYMSRHGNQGRTGEITMKHGVFKFSHFGDMGDGSDWMFTHSANNNQLMLIAEQNEKLFGTDTQYCAKVYHHGLERDWNGGKGMSINRQVQMVPCEDTATSYEQGSWIMQDITDINTKGKSGHIFYEDMHNSGGVHPNTHQLVEKFGSNQNYCMMSAGSGDPVWIRSCNPFFTGQSKYEWHYTQTGNIDNAKRLGLDGNDANAYQGATDYTVYWGTQDSDHSEANKQCMYVNQKNHRLYVATCSDMNFSFGLTRSADYYRLASTNQ